MVVESAEIIWLPLQAVDVGPEALAAIERLVEALEDLQKSIELNDNRSKPCASSVGHAAPVIIGFIVGNNLST